MALTSPWLVEGMRVTMFLAQDAEHLPTGYYKAVFGKDPEQKHIVGTRTVEGGRWGDRGFALVEQNPGRLECRIVPWPGAMPDPLAKVGEHPEMFAQFPKFARKIISMAPKLIRVAFGAILVMPANSLQEGQDILAKLLPAVKFEGELYDFLYRINRPRISNAHPIRINRLSNWSVSRIVNLDIPIGVEGRVREESSSLAARLELDINTDAENRVALPKGKLRGIIDELVQLAEELISEGDIP